jgi:imidazolonepropionase-like amidohydrolase
MNVKQKLIPVLILFSFLLINACSNQKPGKELPVAAQSPAEAIEDAPPSTGVPLVLTGILIDGTGAEPVLDAAVVIKGKRIAAVGPRKEIEIPGNAQIISFPGVTLLPGFINTHVHSKYNESLLETWAREGVTTVRDLAAAADLPWFTLRDKLRTNPKYARVVAAGPVFTVAEGFIKEVSLIVTSPEDAQKKVNQLVDDGADVIKIGLNCPLNPVLSREELAAVVKTAHQRGIPVAAHVISAHGLRIALDAGVDDINHLASFGKKSDVLIQRIVKSGVYWIPTIEPIPPSHREKGIDAFRRFIKAGGKVALGNDSGSLPGVQVGMPIKEIQLMHEVGMTPMQIIAAATRHAALVCNLQDELGTLQPGKLADVLVVEGNPLEDLQTLTNVRLVIHEGVIIRKE